MLKLHIVSVLTKCYLIINLLQPDKSHPVHLHQREGEGEREEPVHV